MVNFRARVTLCILRCVCGFKTLMSQTGCQLAGMWKLGYYMGCTLPSNFCKKCLAHYFLRKRYWCALASQVAEYSKIVVGPELEVEVLHCP